MLNRHTSEKKTNTPTPPQSEDLRVDQSEVIISFINA